MFLGQTDIDCGDQEFQAEAKQLPPATSVPRPLGKHQQHYSIQTLICIIMLMMLVGVEQRRNRKLIQKPKFRFLDQTFGFCRFRFRRKQKDSGEESRKIIFFAFILESESKILNSDF